MGGPTFLAPRQAAFYTGRSRYEAEAVRLARARFFACRVVRRSRARLPLFLICIFLGGGDHQGACSASNNIFAAARRSALMHLITPSSDPTQNLFSRLWSAPWPGAPNISRKRYVPGGQGPRAQGHGPGDKGPGARARDPGPGLGAPKHQQEAVFRPVGPPDRRPGARGSGPKQSWTHPIDATWGGRRRVVSWGAP